MSTARTVIQRVSDWQIAFNIIRSELTPEIHRTVLDTMEKIEGVHQLRSYIDLSRAVMGNDKGAGIIAAMLTQSGISRPTFEVGDGED